MLFELLAESAHVTCPSLELRLQVGLQRELLQLHVVVLALDVQQLLLKAVTARALGCHNLCELVLDAADVGIAFTLRILQTISLNLQTL